MEDSALGTSVGPWCAPGRSEQTQGTGWVTGLVTGLLPDRKVPASFTQDVVIIGGCGHVGLPLGIALADRGLSITLYDHNTHAVETVNAGGLPFQEEGAQVKLQNALDRGTLRASADPAVMSAAEHVVVVVGTPVDEHLNPDPRAITLALASCLPHFVDGQLVILRSTVYPGVTASVEKTFAEFGLDVDVVFCPERIAEGRAMTELFSLPQIVSARTERGFERASHLFSRLTSRIVRLEPEEAELAKLFTNTWRYIQFATANQFFMIANDFGLDFAKIRSAVMDGYPRASGMPGPGFAAGPCLFKDTMQLGAFNDNNFALGHAAMLVNEGLPLYVVSKLAQQCDLAQTTVGLLGMSFKAGSDDTRESLSYKLKRILQFRARAVVCSDPFVTTDPSLLPLERVLEADVLIIATPHEQYASLQTDKPVIDIWNLRGEGARA